MLVLLPVFYHFWRENLYKLRNKTSGDEINKKIGKRGLKKEKGYIDEELLEINESTSLDKEYTCDYTNHF